MNKNKYISLFFVFALCSCTDFPSEEILHNNTTELEFVNSFGKTRSVELDNMTLEEFKLSMIQFGMDTTGIYSWDNYYVVEGDILIPKNSDIYRLQNTRQARHITVLNNETAISVGLSPEYQNYSSWIAAVEEMVSIYNEETDLYFTYNNNNPDILIRPSEDLPLSIYGRSGFPFSEDEPFGIVEINSFHVPSINSFSTSKKLGLLMHEVGHCIGLRHTTSYEDETSIHVPGTSDDDEDSFMRPRMNDTTWHGFSSGDLTMIQSLWPVLYCTINFNNSRPSRTFRKKKGYNLDRTIIPNPVSNKVFAGWYNDQNLTSRANLTIIHENRSLYPKWINKSTEQTVSASTTGSDRVTFTLTQDQTVTLKLRVYKGLNSWTSVANYSSEVRGVVGVTYPTFIMNMEGYISTLSNPLYYERTLPIYLSAGTYWASPYFCSSLGPQNGASYAHGSTDIFITYQ